MPSNRQMASTALVVTSTATMGAILVVSDSAETTATAVAAMSLALIALSFLLERFFPFRPEWNASQGDLKGDLISFVGVFGVLDGLLKFLLPAGAAYVLGGLSDKELALPFPVQVLAVTLLIELGAYGSHRLHHSVGFFWRTHAMHHSAERLYTLNNFRFHPVNHVVNSVLIVVPPILLGFSTESIIAYSALSLPILVLQHANVDFEFSWLNRILNTNEVHRWHHSAEPGETHYNLGRALVIWDQIFGTFVMPKPAGAPKTIGLLPKSKMTHPPAQQFVAQLLHPFGVGGRKVTTAPQGGPVPADGSAQKPGPK